MDASGLDDLPRAYRLGLSLRALGADDPLIADCLGIEVDNVAALLDIGARKLEHVHDAPRPTRPTQDLPRTRPQQVHEQLLKQQGDNDD